LPEDAAMPTYLPPGRMSVLKHIHPDCEAAEAQQHEANGVKLYWRSREEPAFFHKGILATVTPTPAPCIPLHSNFSKVKGLAKAQQTRDVMCKESQTYVRTSQLK
jgi:hypothetical protein